MKDVWKVREKNAVLYFCEVVLLDFGVEGLKADSEYLCGKILVPLRVAAKTSFDG